MIYYLTKYEDFVPQFREVSRSEASSIFGDPDNFKDYVKYFILPIDERMLTNQKDKIIAPAHNDVIILGDKLYAILKLANTFKNGPITTFDFLLGEMTKEKFGESSFPRPT